MPHPWLEAGQPPVILAVGRLSTQKDYPSLIRAFAMVRAKRQARLVILGAGRDQHKTEQRQEEIASLARELGVGDDVDAAGFAANPFAYMSRSAVLALSSLYEGLPAVLIQAMACGCPVVSTDCPTGPREILEDGRYGPLVPVGTFRHLRPPSTGARQPPGQGSFAPSRTGLYRRKGGGCLSGGTVSQRRPSGVGFIRLWRSHAPNLVPRLKHQDVPQQVRVAASPILVLPPELGDERCSTCRPASRRLSLSSSSAQSAMAHAAKRPGVG